MWRGIRARIVGLATVIVILVLVVTASVLLAIQRRLLIDNLDETLAAHAGDLALGGARGSGADPIRGRGDDDSIVQIVTHDGEVFAATANFAARPALPPPPGTSGEAVRTAALLPGEPDYRILSKRAGDHVIHVASPLDDIDENVAALRLGLAVAIPIVAAVLAGVTWWLVGRTLRPVEAIRSEVAAISGQNLDRRVPEPASGDEIERLAVTMNAMLDRVERAARSQQRFVADASHELRNPLTRIRSELEVDLAHPDSREPWETHRSVLEETKQMQRLVEDLLVLARHDAGDPVGAPTLAVDLDDIVLDEVQRLRRDRGARIDTSGVSAAQVDGDVSQLARMVRNLLENAARHTVHAIEVGLVRHDGRAVLTVTDDGPGIPAEHRQRIFERFSRTDPARMGDDGGTGLGLAIVSAIATRHRGTVGVDPDHVDGARFVVEIPLSVGDVP